MVDWFVVLIALFSLPVVLLFVFVGCGVGAPQPTTVTVNTIVRLALRFDPAVVEVTQVRFDISRVNGTTETDQVDITSNGSINPMTLNTGTLSGYDSPMSVPGTYQLRISMPHPGNWTVSCHATYRLVPPGMGEGVLDGTPFMSPVSATVTYPADVVISPDPADRVFSWTITSDPLRISQLFNY
ncbi:MAG TPA: hypothetical protein VGE45_07680 [Chloroflexia bacterium]|jgi:hypothetical protein